MRHHQRPRVDAVSERQGSPADGSYTVCAPPSLSKAHRSIQELRGLATVALAGEANLRAPLVIASFIPAVIVYRIFTTSCQTGISYVVTVIVVPYVFFYQEPAMSDVGDSRVESIHIPPTNGSGPPTAMT